MGLVALTTLEPGALPANGDAQCRVPAPGVRAVDVPSRRLPARAAGSCSSASPSRTAAGACAFRFQRHDGRAVGSGPLAVLTVARRRPRPCCRPGSSRSTRSRRRRRRAALGTAPHIDRRSRSHTSRPSRHPERARPARRAVRGGNAWSAVGRSIVANCRCSRIRAIAASSQPFWRRYARAKKRHPDDVGHEPRVRDRHACRRRPGPPRRRSGGGSGSPGRGRAARARHEMTETARATASTVRNGTSMIPSAIFAASFEATGPPIVVAHSSGRCSGTRIHGPQGLIPPRRPVVGDRLAAEQRPQHREVVPVCLIRELRYPLAGEVRTRAPSEAETKRPPYAAWRVAAIEAVISGLRAPAAAIPVPAIRRSSARVRRRAALPHP